MIAVLRKTRVFPVVFRLLNKLRSIPAKAAALALFGLRAMSGIIHKALKLPACHREFTDIKILAQSDRALRFIFLAARLRNGRTLLKTALGHQFEHQRLPAQIENNLGLLIGRAGHGRTQQSREG